LRLFEAEPQVLRDLTDETKIVATKEHPDFKVYATRHPTLGKVVIVEGRDGRGIIVETEQ
jgi:hypothetical protein